MFFIKIHRSKTKRDINSRFAAFERGEHFPYSTYQFESLSSFVWPPYLSQFAVYKTLLENTFELKYAKNSPASVFYTSLESQKWNKKNLKIIRMKWSLLVHLTVAAAASNIHGNVPSSVIIVGLAGHTVTGHTRICVAAL